MDSIEMTGKTQEEALEKALNILNAKAEEVTVNVLDPGSKGFLGIGQKPVKIQVVLKDNPGRTAKKFIGDVIEAIGLEVITEVKLADNSLTIDLKGSNMGVLIGKHGQTLDALQYLTNLVVNKTTESYINVTLDTENYREKRKETLESLARNMAKKARQLRKPVKLEPMNPSERRIIHFSLQGEKGITTYSEGVEPFRNVVIAPKRDTHYDGKDSRGSDRPYSKYGKSDAKHYAKTDNYKKFISMDSAQDEEDR
ncbi:MAG: protein jag [Clostridiales bacterium]|jgi:spoIIIJ-associated protein|nr:protein jag [Clostridiales bacterium]